MDEDTVRGTDVTAEGSGAGRSSGLGKAGGACLMALLGTLACSGETAPRPSLGEIAPSYRAATLQGDTLALEDLRGEPLLVNVWATWCGPCRFETPFLQSLYEEHRARGLQVVGVSVDQRGARDAVRSFLDEHNVTYRILHDPEMRAMDTFYVLGLPATFLIDASGTLRFIRMGPVGETDREFLAALKEILS